MCQNKGQAGNKWWDGNHRYKITTKSEFRHNGSACHNKYNEEVTLERRGIQAGRYQCGIEQRVNKRQQRQRDNHKYHRNGFFSNTDNIGIEPNRGCSRHYDEGHNGAFR